MLFRSEFNHGGVELRVVPDTDPMIDEPAVAVQVWRGAGWEPCFSVLKDNPDPDASILELARLGIAVLRACGLTVHEMPDALRTEGL